MKVKKLKRSNWKDDDDNDDLYDEIDRFHMEHDQLSDSDGVVQRPKREEILNVEGDISDEEEDLVYPSGSEESDFDSPEEEDNIENLLPSADKWSKKKSQFYGTSYVDQDWGGMNENELELAELEEQDATMRQKRLDATLSFLKNEKEMMKPDDSDIVPEKKVAKEELTEEEKLDKFIELNPEYSKMMDEYKEKRRVFYERISPLKAAVDANCEENKTILEEQIRLAYRVFVSYLLNIMFYFRLKLTTGLKSSELNRYLEDHPVIDAIIVQKKMMMRVEQFLERNEEVLSNLLEMHKSGSSLNAVLKSSGFADDFLNELRKKKKDVEPDVDECIVQETENEEPSTLNPEKDTVDDKRAVSTEIQKNKGLITKRKKGTHHSRVKKRKQYEKALIKKRSQRPDVRREIEPYSGEKRGIRISSVKSIKLKA